MMLPNSLRALIRMTHRVAPRVVHALDCAPIVATSSAGSISSVVMGCDEEPHPGAGRLVGLLNSAVPEPGDPSNAPSSAHGRPASRVARLAGGINDFFGA
jgi:hypothetical protein